MPDNHGIPSFRGVAHIIANDPGIYFRDHYGCIAYFYDQGIPGEKSLAKMGEESHPYICCNRRVEQLDLASSRAALLKLLVNGTYGDMEHFISTLTCDRHQPSQSQTSFLCKWWREELRCMWVVQGKKIIKANLAPGPASGYCACGECFFTKLVPRWDAGMKSEEHERAYAVARHQIPDEVSRQRRSAKSAMAEQTRTALETEHNEAVNNAMAEQAKASAEAELEDATNGEALTEPKGLRLAFWSRALQQWVASAQVRAAAKDDLGRLSLPIRAVRCRRQH